MKLNITTKDGRPINLATPQTMAWLRFGAIVMFIAFCLWGTKTMISRAIYVQKVVSANNKALNQINQDIKNASNLSSQYSGLFENSNPINFLGGTSDTSSQAVPPNIDNARLALDALPTTYDYPALLAQVTKILTNKAISSPNISGTDQSALTSSIPTANPAPVAIKLSISGVGNYSTVQSVLRDLERSIRPFDVTNLQLSGTENNLTFTANVTTYFQPAKVLSISESSVH